MDEQYDPQMRYTELETKVSNIAFKDMDFSDPFKELPKALSAVKKEMNTKIFSRPGPMPKKICKSPFSKMTKIIMAAATQPSTHP